MLQMPEAERHEAPDATVIVPALNEQETLGEVVQRILDLPIRVQVIVVDDGSSDATPQVLRSFGARIEVITNERPGGKGTAVRLALGHAKGRAVVIQDADLEYFPEDIPALVEPILNGSCGVDYGTRLSQGLPKGMALPNKIVNVLLAWSVRLLYLRRITDEATCYKAFRSDLPPRMNLKARHFEICPEMTAKAIRLGERIVELPIRYAPRTKTAGKKIRWTDAPEAFWTLLKYRFVRF